MSHSTKPEPKGSAMAGEIMLNAAGLAHVANMVDGSFEDVSIAGPPDFAPCGDNLVASALNMFFEALNDSTKKLEEDTTTLGTDMIRSANDLSDTDATFTATFTNYKVG